MTVVNWDQPSRGVVSDPRPALTLENGRDGALAANSSGVAVDAVSHDAEAIRAATTATLTARFASQDFVALFAHAPVSVAALGMNYAKSLPAVMGTCLPDPKIPNVADNLGGIGVLGFTTRYQAAGTVGLATGPRSLGVRGIGTEAGVEGASATGHGVQGFSWDGLAEGVFGYAPGPVGSGVLGRSLAGPGVTGFSTAGPGIRAMSEQAEGVVAHAQTANAAAIRARNDHPAGFAVDAQSDAGIGVNVRNYSGTGLNITTLGDGAPVRVYSAASTAPAVAIGAVNSEGLRVTGLGGAGVWCSGLTGIEASSIASPGSDPRVGTGVYAYSMSGTGISGLTATGIGVLGIVGGVSGGWAGVFRGNVRIDGILYKSASLFSIDHPLDPKRKRLNHAAVEAPEYKTFYDGIATLNRKGEARIRLPNWFGALNGDLRYQLTPLGRPAPDLHVAQEVGDLTFRIAGGAPGQKVCWQITGIRRDRWAKKNPLAVEHRKEGFEPQVVMPSRAELKRRDAMVAAEHARMRKISAQPGPARPSEPRRSRALAAPPPTAAASEAVPSDELLALTKRLDERPVQRRPRKRQSA